MDLSTTAYMEPNVENTSDLLNIYIEKHPDYIKSIFVCVAILSLFSSIVAIIVLRRTRRIPHASKFLTTGLLSFDLLYISSITVRKFIQDPIYNTTLNVLSNTLLQLAYVTVALMSMERFFMFHRPMKYMQFCTEELVHYVAITIWILTVAIFQSVRYGFCYVVIKSNLVFQGAGQCNQIVTIYYSALVTVVLVTSMVCYWNVFCIVRKQLKKSENKHISFVSTATTLRTYKSTSLVLVYLLVMLCTSATYAIIIVFIRYANLEVAAVRLSLESISIINCILDPFLYVLWFKESQMELCRLFSPFSKKLQKRAEEMKYEVFDIVTTTTCTPVLSRNNPYESSA